MSEETLSTRQQTRPVRWYQRQAVLLPLVGLLTFVLGVVVGAVVVTPESNDGEARIAELEAELADAQTAVAQVDPEPEPSPELEPVPEPEPVASIRSAEVVAAFQAAGLEAADPRPMTREDHGMAPLVSDDATRFLIPSLGEDSGGRVFVVHDNADRARLKEYYDELGRASAMFYSHTFEVSPVLVQINGELPDDQAERYGEVLRQVVEQS